MEIVSCWSIFQMSSEFPEIRFANPLEGMTVGYEER
jgi:hypothetical protein